MQYAVYTFFHGCHLMVSRDTLENFTIGTFRGCCDGRNSRSCESNDNEWLTLHLRSYAKIHWASNVSSETDIKILWKRWKSRSWHIDRSYIFSTTFRSKHVLAGVETCWTNSKMAHLRLFLKLSRVTRHESAVTNVKRSQTVAWFRSSLAKRTQLKWSVDRT